MNYYVIKLKTSGLFISGYINYRVRTDVNFQNAMIFSNLTFANEFDLKYLNGEGVIYEINLTKL
jgi:hypothetical protein